MTHLNYGAIEKQLRSSGIDIEKYNSPRIGPYPLYALLKDSLTAEKETGRLLMHYAIESYSDSTVTYILKHRTEEILDYCPDERDHLKSA